MSVKQTVASLKQQLTNLISNKIAVDMTTAAFKDDEFVRELMSRIIEKWNAEGNASLNVMMNDKEKEAFEKYLLAKHKSLMNGNLTLVTNASQKEGFVVQPKDGSYKITFSEKVFEEFFNAYIKEYSKKLLFS
jgi:V/A-type H+-transporting ATPase subunit E